MSFCLVRIDLKFPVLKKNIQMDGQTDRQEHPQMEMGGHIYKQCLLNIGAPEKKILRDLPRWDEKNVKNHV